MVRNIALGVLLVASPSVLAAAQQDRCAQPSNQNKVGCTLSHLYDSPSYTGVPLGTLPIYQNGQQANDNGFDFHTNHAALTATLGTELSTLPLTAPGSGFVYQYDAATGLEARSTQSLGPILAERGDTIGRHKVFVAFAYQYFRFTTQDGNRTNSLHNVLQHTADSPPAAEDSDLVTTNDAIDLKIHQFTGFVTFGVTDRIDISAVVPILNVRFGAYSTATIQNIAPRVSHSFCALGSPCLTSSFSNFQWASGIGDVIFRVKAKVWGSEHSKLAVGTDLRVPSGDAMNFRGSGTFGARPFAAFSYSKHRIAPHANLGFQINGDSVLAGDFSKGTKAHLPNELTYSVGTDFGVTSRFTLAGDWMGELVINGFNIHQSTCNETYPPTSGLVATCVLGASGGTCLINGQQQPCTFPVTTSTRSSYSMNDISIGAKISPFKRLLITANAILKLDDPGLRSKVIPLVGIGYTF
jgi:outer membrane putative beta-barrel porin/alpha-amylase